MCDVGLIKVEDQAILCLTSEPEGVLHQHLHCAAVRVRGNRFCVMLHFAYSEKTFAAFVNSIVANALLLFIVVSPSELCAYSRVIVGHSVRGLVAWIVGLAGTSCGHNLAKVRLTRHCKTTCNCR